MRDGWQHLRSGTRERYEARRCEARRYEVRRGDVLAGGEPRWGHGSGGA